MAGWVRAAIAFGLATAVADPALAQAGASPPRPVIVRPDADESLQWAASVVRLDPLRRQSGTAKLFGTAGGDPAMNGLYTHLAFFQSVDEGWRVFRLGDFLSYRIVEESPGRLLLEVRKRPGRGKRRYRRPDPPPACQLESRPRAAGLGERGRIALTARCACTASASARTT